MSLTQRPRHNTHARLSFASLFSTARHVSRRSRLWKAVGGAVAALLAVGMVGMGFSLAASASSTATTVKYGTTFTYNGVDSWTVTNTGGSTSLNAIGSTQKWLCSPNNVGAGVTACTTGSYIFTSLDKNTAGQSCAYVQGDGSPTYGSWDTVPNESAKGVCADEPSVSPTPTGTPCVSSPTYAYTYNATTSSGVVSVTNAGANIGDKLCDTLHARATTWNYQRPTTGNSPSWSQDLDSYQDVVVDTIGDHSYAAPNVTGVCQQHDIYATFLADWTTALKLPAVLTAPGQGVGAPEPPFLHGAFAGKHLLPTSPNPTYHADVSTGCSVTSAPVVSASAGTCTYSNGRSNTPVVLTYDNTGSNLLVTFSVTGDSSLDRTVAGGSVVTVTGSPLVFPASQTYTVSASAKDYSHTFTLPVSSTDCAPPPEVRMAVTDPHASTCENTGESELASWIFVALSPNASYKIDGTPVTTAYTSVTPGSHVVTVDAVGNVVLVGENNEWSGTHHEWAPFTAVDTSTGCIATGGTATPVVTQSAATCAASGSYTLSVEEPELVGDILWTVDGKSAVAGTYTAAAGTTVHVVATAVEGTGISGSETGSQEWTITVAAPSTDCAQLKTLAFTGADGSMGGMLIFALFLLLGGAGVYTASRFRSRES